MSRAPGRASASRPLAVIGGGAWGTALAQAAALAERDVVLWMRDQRGAERMAEAGENARYLPGIGLDSRIRPTARLDEVAEAGAVLLVTPAQTTRAMIADLARVIPARTPLVLCAKGIERGSGAFLSDIADEARPGSPLAVLSGPGFAADVVRGLPTAVVLASRDAGLAEHLAALLSGPTFRVYHGGDVRGVEIGGAAKNVLAIACGIVAGRGLGASAGAALIARGFAELLRFAVAHGGRPETLMGLSGLGDLVLTCSSAQSRNFAFGQGLGQGKGVEAAAGGKLAEGALTADVLVARARAKSIALPVSEAVAAIVAGRLTVDGAVEALMSRPLRAEG